MSVIALKLEDWSVCPDGYGLHERETPGTTLPDQAVAGIYLQPRSRKREKRSFLTHNVAKDSFVLEFINARDDKALLKFVDKYGLLDVGEEMKLERVVDLRDDLRLLLHLLSPARAAPLFRGPRLQLGLEVLRKESVLVLRAATLAEYLRAEAALLLAGAATILVCERCSGLFTGRSDAQCCSDTCRRALNRQKHR